ncbi:putative transcription regulator Others family [Helianthus annuus]|nr:putative transcription regulator Others family [Helianthus annuus]
MKESWNERIHTGFKALDLGFNDISNDVLAHLKGFAFKFHKSFLEKRFQNDDHVYKSFLDMLNMYWKEQKGINEVYHEVAALFDDQPDLLDEFTKFMPDASAAASAHNASLGRHRYNEQRSSAMGPHKQAQTDIKPRGGNLQVRINGSI